MPQVLGFIKRINALKQVSETFKSQELILTTEEQYAQTLSIEFKQEKSDLLKSFSPGDKVKIEINLQGREITKEGDATKVFNTLSAWKIDKAI